MRPRSVSVAARWFQDNLKADVFYAVKANPSHWVVETLVEAGVRGFDVASLAEIELVRSVSRDARLAFMHPVKSRGAIRAAYADHGVRTFVLDSHDELNKILEATGRADELDFRFPIQYVIREHASDYRGYAGRVKAGSISVGDEVRLPEGRTSTITSAMPSSGPQASAKSRSGGWACSSEITRPMKIGISASSSATHIPITKSSRKTSFACLA